MPTLGKSRLSTEQGVITPRHNVGCARIDHLVTTRAPVLLVRGPKPLNRPLLTVARHGAAATSHPFNVKFDMGLTPWTTTRSSTHGTILP